MGRIENFAIIFCLGIVTYFVSQFFGSNDVDLEKIDNDEVILPQDSDQKSNLTQKTNNSKMGDENTIPSDHSDNSEKQLKVFSKRVGTAILKNPEKIFSAQINKKQNHLSEIIEKNLKDSENRKLPVIKQRGSSYIFMPEMVGVYFKEAKDITYMDRLSRNGQFMVIERDKVAGITDVRPVLYDPNTKKLKAWSGLIQVKVSNYNVVKEIQAQFSSLKVSREFQNVNLVILQYSETTAESISATLDEVRMLEGVERVDLDLI